MLLRARTLLPVSAPPVEDGAVWVSGGQIRGVGRWRDLRRSVAGPVADLGDSAVFPGLVNAHCHLDYTDLAGLLPPPRSFADWIKSILTAKAAWGYSEFAASWLNGARQLLSTGTTTVANIEAVPEMVRDVRATTPLRVHSFLEMTGIRSGRPASDLLDQAEAVLDSLAPDRGGVGFSPHSPYSTRPELLQDTARRAAARGWRVTTHVSESAEEFDMFMFRRGPLHDWLAPQRNMEDCGLGSPVRHLERNGLLGPTLLAVHVNYLWGDDADRLARNGVAVVHCPRSHRYFRHQRFPRSTLAQAGVRLAIGTDSLASTRKASGRRPILSMLHELAALAAVDDTLSPGELLRLGTEAGAEALGLKGRAGSLMPGAWADLAWIAHPGNPEEAAEAIVHHPGAVDGVLINGVQVWPAPSSETPPERPVQV